MIVEYMAIVENRFLASCPMESHENSLYSIVKRYHQLEVNSSEREIIAGGLSEMIARIIFQINTFKMSCGDFTFQHYLKSESLPYKKTDTFKEVLHNCMTDIMDPAFLNKFELNYHPSDTAYNPSQNIDQPLSEIEHCFQRAVFSLVSHHFYLFVKKLKRWQEQAEYQDSREYEETESDEHDSYNSVIEKRTPKSTSKGKHYDNPLVKEAVKMIPNILHRKVFILKSLVKKS